MTHLKLRSEHGMGDQLMPSDAKNIDVFNRTVNDPESCKLQGLDLHTAADVLREKAIEGMSRPDWSNPLPNDLVAGECFKYAGLVFQAAMLQGFAVECLLKYFWIVQGNTVAAR